MTKSCHSGCQQSLAKTRATLHNEGVRPSRYANGRVPILFPVALAFALVATTVVQAVRAAQLHRRAVEAAVRDYASFAVWQYSRRASDYLRLTILNGIHNSEPRTAVSCELGSSVSITRNTSGVPDSVLASAMAIAAGNATRSHLLSGMVALSHRREFLGYVLRSSNGSVTRCEANLIDTTELVAVFRHVAEFAPLLPPSFVGYMPNDSLVTIRLLDSAMNPLATSGASSTGDGVRAEDHLSPDLADVLVAAMLRPAAIERLSAGGIAPSNTATLLAMLFVTLVLCIVAVQQVRRTNEIARLRSDFVASVSHELKTPLAQISLFAATLATRDRPFDERLQYLRIISREATRLGQLVDRILHFAGMSRAVVFSDSREDVDVYQELRDAIAAIEPIAAARGTTIELIQRGNARLVLDRDAFRQLILNLLDNAVKFGPAGQQVRVSVALDRQDAVIDVDDEGPGISESASAEIFDPFVRGTQRGVSGSGIGLAVVRDVTAQHGGAVAVLRSPCGGARFRVRLPRATEAAARDTPEVRA